MIGKKVCVHHGEHAVALRVAQSVLPKRADWCSRDEGYAHVFSILH